MMDKENGVKVVEVCLVAPKSGSPTSLPLTFYDRRCLRLLPVEHLFFYEFPKSSSPPSSSCSSFFDSVVPNLKHSLSLTLQHFLPFAGNLTWSFHDSSSPFPIINYNPGDAVPLTIAESSNPQNFNIICSNLCEESKRHPLIPFLNTSDEKASLLAIQATLFPTIGFCIGITTHHAAADGIAISLFIRAWAYTCSKLLMESSPLSLSSLSLPEHLIPLYDRSVIRDSSTSTILEPNNRSLKLSYFRARGFKGLFELTPSHIHELKQHAKSKLKMKKVVRLSTYSVTFAFVLMCLAKTKQTNLKRVVFSISVNCRSRLDPPIMPTYFGNCSGPILGVIETTKLLENDGFMNALNGILEALNRMEDAMSDESMDSRLKPFMEDDIVTIFGSPILQFYSVDFGWGKPKRVDLPILDKVVPFSFSESRNKNGGIEIGLTLNKKEIEAFSHHFTVALKSLVGKGTKIRGKL
ncbi:hypothetical protein RIF29_18217 [Crotalaria pallida]|uniref:Uncharacterized protein n=1 Tax=Crotalaria pallida TaxID=3830 RepID=A0AAN9FSA5_CROPI